MPNGTKPAVT